MISHGSISSSRSGTRSRWTSTPAPPRAISASEEASPAAPQSCSDSTSPASTSSSEASISFLPVNGSPTWTDGRFSSEPSPSSWLASTEAPPIPSRPVVAPKRTSSVAGRLRLRAGDPLGREQPDAHRVDEAVAARRPRRRPPRRRRSARRRSCRSGRFRRPRAGKPRPARRSGGRRAAQPAARPSRRCRAGSRRRRWPRPGTARPRGMVVRLDLERDRLALAEVDHARVLARPLQHALAGATAAASGAAPSACSRSAPTRAARRRRARNGSARARAAHRFARTRSR